MKEGKLPRIAVEGKLIKEQSTPKTT